MFMDSTIRWPGRVVDSVQGSNPNPLVSVK